MFPPKNTIIINENHIVYIHRPASTTSQTGAYTLSIQDNTDSKAKFIPTTFILHQLEERAVKTHIHHARPHYDTIHRKSARVEFTIIQVYHLLTTQLGAVEQA